LLAKSENAGIGFSHLGLNEAHNSSSSFADDTKVTEIHGYGIKVPFVSEEV
jgi:hypothetical protein